MTKESTKAAIPTASQLRNSDFAGVFDKYAQCNHADLKDKEAALEMPTTVVAGCINTIDFEKAAIRDTYNERAEFDDVITVTKAKKTSAFIKALVQGAADLVEDKSALDPLKVSLSKANVQRFKTRRFASKWIVKIKELLAEYGDTVDYFLSDEDGIDLAYAAFCVDDAALVYDEESDRIYVLFNGTPKKEIKKWLKETGFTTGGTYSLWYRESEIKDTDEFKDYAKSFGTILGNVYKGISKEYHKKATHMAAACTTL